MALAILFYSCKAYRNLENINPKVPKEIQAGPFDKSELEKLIPDDKIVVKSTSGIKYYMTYQNYTEDKLVGSVWKVDESRLETPNSQEIPLDEIEILYVRRVSAAATAPIAVFGAFVIFYGILAILLSSGDGFGWQ